MMSDLLASDNINLHNRVGKRDHAHTTLAPPHHESQRTRDQRKGPPPFPKATPNPDRRKAQRAGRGPATSKPAREPHTVTTAPTNNQQFTARGGRGVQCTKSWRRETADSPAWPPRGPTVRAEPTCTCSVPRGVRYYRNATQGPARDGRRAGWQGKRRRQHARQLQPSHTRPDQRAPPTRAGPIHSNQHAKSVCWAPAHRPRAGRPNT